MYVQLLQYDLNQTRSVVILFSFFRCRLPCSVKPDKNWTNSDKGAVWKLRFRRKTGFEPVKTRFGQVWTGLQQSSQFGMYKPSSAINFIFPHCSSCSQYFVRLRWPGKLTHPRVMISLIPRSVFTLPSPSDDILDFQACFHLTPAGGG